MKQHNERHDSDKWSQMLYLMYIYIYIVKNATHSIYNYDNVKNNKHNILFKIR